MLLIASFAVPSVLADDPEVSDPTPSATAIAGHAGAGAESVNDSARKFAGEIVRNLELTTTAAPGGAVPVEEAGNVTDAAETLGGEVAAAGRDTFASIAGEAAGAAITKISEARDIALGGQSVVNSGIGAGFGVAAAAAGAACDAPVPTPPGSCSGGSIVQTGNETAQAVADAGFDAAEDISPDSTLCAVRDGLNGLVPAVGEAVPCSEA